MSGKFIVFEGIDGSGKTTQIQLLSEYLKSKSANFILTKNPTHGRIGSLLKEYYLKNKTAPLADALLFAADRAEQAETIIKPALKENKIIISDRYYYSNWVYQSEEGIDIRWLMELNKFFPKPDLTILIDIQPSTALLRIKTERHETEKFEKTKVLENTRKKYLEIAKKEKFAVVNGNRKIEEIHADIVKEIEKII